MAMSSAEDTSSIPIIPDHFPYSKPRNSPTAAADPFMRSKSAISSLLLSPFSNKKSLLSGFGCTSHPQVSVPSIIRSSALWEDSRDAHRNTVTKKKKKKKKKKGDELVGVLIKQDSVSVAQDLWCGLDSASVDCVRPRPLLSRPPLPRQHGSYSSRQRVNPDQFGGLHLDSSFDASRIGPKVFETRYSHHSRNRSPEALAEILMFQNGLLLSRRSGGLDRYRELRLDVDSMTYEELLELGERIGNVNTGLGEDQIRKCLRKAKISGAHESSSQAYVSEVERKCSICQDEYEAEDEMGKLECGHAYHLNCIKQWLARKNTCPVCKAEASSP